MEDSDDNSESYWSVALRFIPIVGTLTDVVQGIYYACQGKNDIAVQKFISAGVGLVADIATSGETRAGAKALAIAVKTGAKVKAKRIAGRQIAKGLICMGISRVEAVKIIKKVTPHLQKGEHKDAVLAAKDAFDHVKDQKDKPLLTYIISQIEKKK